MKKILTLLLVLCLLLSVTACGEPAATEPEKDSLSSTTPDTTEPKPEEGLVAIYVPLSETHYNADGSKGDTRVDYTHDDMGNLLTIAYDKGPQIEYLDEEWGIMMYDWEAYDGMIDWLYQWEYDDMGNAIDYSCIYGQYNDEGQWIEETRYQYNAIQDYQYRYGSDGKPENYSVYYLQDLETASDKRCYTYFRYDDNGNLCRVESDDSVGEDKLVLGLKFSYDGENRLTEAYYYTIEQAKCFRYDYDDAGRLVRNTLLTALSEAREDETVEFHQNEYAEFEYNENGDLLSRKRYDRNGELSDYVTCEYDDSGRLSRVCYYDDTDTLEDSFTYTYDGDKTLCLWEMYDEGEPDGGKTLTYDQHGNLVHETGEDGAYIVYEYETLYVTEEVAARYRKIQFLNAGREPGGYQATFLSSQSPRRGIPGGDFFILVPFPTTVLHTTDALKAR